MALCYAGDSYEIQFEATLEDGSVLPLPDGTEVYFALKLDKDDADPATIDKANLAAGGAETEAHITSETLGTFSVYLTPADTEILTPEETYEFDAAVKMASGDIYTVGKGSITAVRRVTSVPVP
jgi:hypothetical protein